MHKGLQESPKMRYQITSYQLLKQMIAELRDDPTLPWQTYPCLLWPRSKNLQGYGHCWVEGKYMQVHRVAYTIAVKPIPDGYSCCHRCDVGACFRPIHLFAGTRSDNMRDCASKG